jgi:hypothetical protein
MAVRLLLQESQTGCGPEIDGRRRSLHGRHHGTGVRQARPQERLNSANVAVIAGDITCTNKTIHQTPEACGTVSPTFSLSKNKNKKQKKTGNLLPVKVKRTKAEAADESAPLRERPNSVEHK